MHDVGSVTDRFAYAGSSPVTTAAVVRGNSAGHPIVVLASTINLPAISSRLRLLGAEAVLFCAALMPAFDSDGSEMAPYTMQTPINEGSSTNDRLIYSRHDAAIRRLRSLQTREGRERTGQFLIEGVRPLAQAVRQGVRVETIVVAPQLLTNPLGQRLVKQQRIAATPCYRLTPEVYHSLSQAEEPQGVAAVMRQRWENLEQVRPSRGLCWIAVEAVQSAGNLGTILRTSEAVGGSGVILIGDTVDPYDPATVRASMGALFSQKFVRATVEGFAAWKQRHQCLLVGTSPTASIDYKAVTYPNSLVLLMGSEKKGVSPEVRALCDTMVKIPMVGRGDSLNLGIAAGILLYEVFNQRRSHADPST